MVSKDVMEAAKTLENACHGFTFDGVFPGDVQTEKVSADCFLLTIFGPRKVREFTVTISEAE